MEIPEVAIREALLNAIVHRNYHIKAPIKIAIFDNRIEIFSPGQFPGPLNLNNLKAGITYLRNPIICKIFRETGYVEKLGTGFITIFESYEKRGLTVPQIIEGENYVKCILPREELKSNEFTIIMQLFDHFEEISINAVMQLLSLSRATAGRRLKVLVDQGKIERFGHTKAVRYRRLSRS